MQLVSSFQKRPTKLILTETFTKDIVVPWEALLLFDFLIFVLTFVRTHSAWRARKAGGRDDLYALMFWDGKCLHACRYQQGMIF